MVLQLNSVVPLIVLYAIMRWRSLVLVTLDLSTSGMMAQNTDSNIRSPTDALLLRMRIDTHVGGAQTKGMVQGVHE